MSVKYVEVGGEVGNESRSSLDEGGGLPREQYGGLNVGVGI